MNEAKVRYLKPDATEFDNALSQLAVALADGVPHKLIEDLLVLGEDMDNLRYVDSYPTNASVITISIKEPLNNVAQVTYNSSWGVSETLEPHMGGSYGVRGEARKAPKSPQWGRGSDTPLRWAQVGPMKPPGDAPLLSGW